MIGDFTGMIGDPTDKSATRKKLTREEVLENAKSYKKQADGYLDFEGDNPALVKYNSEWHDKLSFRDLIEVSSNFTVQQMMQRDMFQQRIKDEKPIHLHEFLYPLAQGYDSMAMDVDLEIGGNDQMFNMMCGRDLMKAEGKKEKFVLTMKLLADDSGKKMGKSEGNAVFLDQDPVNMYGVVMSWQDGVIGVGFELATKVSFKEVKEIHKQLEDGKTNPRDLKMKLAFEIVKANCGEAEAKKAQDNFVSTIQKKEAPKEIKIFEPKEKGILSVLMDSGLCTSKGEARRVVMQNGVKIDGEVVSEPKTEVSSGQVIQKGKFHFIKIA